MEADIKKYENQNKTGNKVLDTVLTTKKLYCAKHNMRLQMEPSPDFMDVMDICNVLTTHWNDELKIPDKEKRLIPSCLKTKNFLLLRPEKL